VQQATFCVDQKKVVHFIFGHVEKLQTVGEQLQELRFL
jgi:hypothetical protein